MAGIRYEGDFRKLRHAVQNLENFDYKKLNKLIGQEIRLQTLERFDDQEDPEGKPWPVSIRVQNEGGQTLSKTGALATSIKVRATSQGVAVGTNLVYARIHQKGGTLKARTIVAKNAKALKMVIGGKVIYRKKARIPPVQMPKREYMGINEEGLKAIVEIMEDQVKEHVEP